MEILIMTKNIIITSTITALILAIFLPGACLTPLLPALIFAPIIGGVAALLLKTLESKRTEDFSISIPLGLGVISGIVAGMMASTTSLFLSC